MCPRATLPKEITTGRLVAVLRGPDAEHVLPVAVALYASGVRCIEVALTTSGALTAVSQLVNELDTDIAIGVGTVRTVDDVAAAVGAGAGFLLAPVFDPTVIHAAAKRGIPIIGGAATPTEIAAAWARGVAAVKVFPAAALGGPGFVRSVLDPLPDIPLIPTGGVRAEHVGDYLAAGAIAVGIGSPLVGDALTGGSLEALCRRARKFVCAAQEYAHRP